MLGLTACTQAITGEVALYIHLYGRLPSNYVTKNQANSLCGWKNGSLDAAAENDLFRVSFE